MSTQTIPNHLLSIFLNLAALKLSPSSRNLCQPCVFVGYDQHHGQKEESAYGILRTRLASANSSGNSILPDVRRKNAQASIRQRQTNLDPAAAMRLPQCNRHL